MNFYTQQMHTRIKLTKAQRNNLKIVLKSFYYQQVTPNKEEHFRGKFVKTLSTSQRSGSTFYGSWEAKGLSFPISNHSLWNSQRIRLTATQFKAIEHLFQRTEHVNLRSSRTIYLELNWSKIHMVENILPLIFESLTEANKLMESRSVADKRNYDFIVRMIKKYRFRYAHTGIKWATGKKLREYHYENGQTLFSRNEVEMLYNTSERVKVEVDSVTLPEEERYVSRYDIS